MSLKKTGTNKMKKKYFIISGMSLRDNNRGTAALGYGAISFLLEKGFVTEDMELLEIKYNDSFFPKSDVCEKLSIQGKVWDKRTVFVSFLYTQFFTFMEFVSYKKQSKMFL